MEIWLQNELKTYGNRCRNGSYNFTEKNLTRFVFAIRAHDRQKKIPAIIASEKSRWLKEFIKCVKVAEASWQDSPYKFNIKHSKTTYRLHRRDAMKWQEKLAVLKMAGYVIFEIESRKQRGRDAWDWYSGADTSEFFFPTKASTINDAWKHLTKKIQQNNL